MNHDEHLSRQRLDDYISARPGTPTGDWRRAEIASQRGPHPSLEGIEPTRPPYDRGPSKPWFPAVDAWFDQHLPIPLRRKIALILIAIGAILGIGLAPQLGIGTGWAVGLGAFAGMALIPLLMFAIKLTLVALMLGFAALVGYAVYSAF